MVPRQGVFGIVPNVDIKFFLSQFRVRDIVGAGGQRLSPMQTYPMAAGPKRQSGWKTARHSDCLFSRLYSRFRAGLG